MAPDFHDRVIANITRLEGLLVIDPDSTEFRSVDEIRVDVTSLYVDLLKRVGKRTDLGSEMFAKALMRTAYREKIKGFLVNMGGFLEGGRSNDNFTLFYAALRDMAKDVTRFEEGLAGRPVLEGADVHEMRFVTARTRLFERYYS